MQARPTFRRDRRRPDAGTNRRPDSLPLRAGGEGACLFRSRSDRRVTRRHRRRLVRSPAPRCGVRLSYVNRQTFAAAAHHELAAHRVELRIGMPSVQRDAPFESTLPAIQHEANFVLDGLGSREVPQPLRRDRRESVRPILRLVLRPPVCQVVAEPDEPAGPAVSATSEVRCVGASPPASRIWSLARTWSCLVCPT